MSVGDIAELAALCLSQEHYVNQLFVQVPEEVWDSQITQTPAWVHRYFLPPEQAVRQFQEDTAFIDAKSEEPIYENMQTDFAAFLCKLKAMSKETIGEVQGLLQGDGTLTLDLGDETPEDFANGLAILRASHAENRARTTYGQGMYALVSAGQRGNDEGYFRAVSIDPTVQCHPVLIERLSREAMAGRSSFAGKLRKAATEGPPGKIDKELGQLRFVLAFFREIGVLQKLSDAQRYEFFCQRLELYSHTDKNPKAALCTFIKRWEANLV